jgi:nicotinate phosphoribosyltransferase
MAKTQDPTTRSFLDTDHYKPTMGQFVFHRYADVPVKYAFKNRTKGVNLAEVIDEGDLRDQLDRIQNLKPTGEEIAYLRTLKNNGGPLFQEDYLDFIENIKLPDYKLTRENGDFKLEFEGPWATGIYWETPALATMNELYFRAILGKMDSEQVAKIMKEGNNRLEEKVNVLKQNPGAKFMEFGTRRRLSAEHQENVTRYLKENVPSQMIGTSNIYLAKTLGIAPKGTMAHETFMVMSGIMHGNDDEIRASHNQVLQEWWDEYGADLSIALSDTYGSEFFFKDMTEQQARDWKGQRQDSGNPADYAEKEIRFYEGKGIDPREKAFVPSDGLDVHKIVNLHNKFNSRIATAAGWGTNLSNDIGLRPLSLVIKAVESNGHGTVKLSDNPAKATGKPKDIERFKRIFEYDDAKYAAEECVY